MWLTLVEGLISAVGKRLGSNAADRIIAASNDGGVREDDLFAFHMTKIFIALKECHSCFSNYRFALQENKDRNRIDRLQDEWVSSWINYMEEVLSVSHSIRIFAPELSSALSQYGDVESEAIELESEAIIENSNIVEDFDNAVEIMGDFIRQNFTFDQIFRVERIINKSK